MMGAISPAVKEKIDAFVQAQPAQRITPGIAVAISISQIPERRLGLKR
jgi:hypothetical protein